MRKKEECIVFTFESTTQAMKVEKTAKKLNAPGRIIPVPTQISAGCGLAYSALIEHKDNLMALFQEHDLNFQSTYEIMV